jgi:predicted Zn-dependent protease
MYSVSGMVSDAQSHSALNSIRVELRSFGGGTVASGFTSGNGNFELPNVPNGSYELVVEGSGYQDAQMRVDVRGDLHGVAVDLRPIPTSSGAAVGGATVSKRELSIPRNAHEDMQKGLALLNGKSDFQGSIKQFQRAVREYPDYYEAYTAMGIAYIRSGDAANAEQSLRKALDQSEQKYGDALYWLALLMSNGQKFADAEPLARKAVELNANSWEANSELARALDGLGHPVEAETSALAAIKLRPDNGNLYLILANIHIELDKKQALVDDLNAYLKLAPSGQFASQAREQRDQVQKELQSTQASPSTPAGNNP